MASQLQSADPAKNQLLQALEPTVRAPLLGRMTLVVHKLKDVLYEPDQLIDAVYFPVDGVISLVTPLADGAIVEVATVGNEGIVGVPLVRGGSFTVRAISQVPGKSLRIDADAYLNAVERPGPFNAIVSDYTQALFGQISQAAACNRLHSNEERLARWLLMSHDRVGVDDFVITHEFLGQMLGSRRATVTLSAGVLQAAGLIRYHRGRVVIVDRLGLEEVSCECYQVIKDKLDGVLARANGHSPNGR
jgi:CRP-like cAMP-binding protein